MDRIRAVLQTVVKGGHVDAIDMVEALAELDKAEAALAGRELEGALCIGNPETTPEDKAIKLLGDTFMTLQTFMLEMRHKRAFKHVYGYVADALIDCRRYLVAHGYEPLMTTKSEHMNFKPVVYDDPKSK